MSTETHTIKRIQNAEADLNWAAMELDQREHFLHIAVVEARICRAYEPDHYGEIEYHPSGWHTYKFDKKAPFSEEV